MFSFCSQKVKPHPPTGELFFAGRPPGKIVRDAGPVWMSGKRICRKADGFGEPKAASAAIRR
jgi:hypothetical protein